MIKTYRIELEEQRFESLLQEAERRRARGVRGGSAWLWWDVIVSALRMSSVTAVPVADTEARR